VLHEGGNQLARKVSPFKIGLFALICLVLIAGAAIWLKAAFWFQNAKIYATYFNVSVKGLQTDAVINYQGVPVGRIYDIRIGPDGRLIEVLMKLRADFQVDNTLAAHLREQGLTGLRYLEIGSAPNDTDQLTPKITFPTKYPFIRSYPSELDLLEIALQNLYAKFISLDLEGLTGSWKKTSSLFNNLLAQLGADSPGGGDLKETITALKNTSKHSEALFERLSRAASRERVDKGMQDLTATLASARKFSDQLRQQLDALPPGTLKRLSDQFGETLQSGGTAFSNLGTRINESADLLDSYLQQLGALIAQLNSLVQSVKEQPNRLIFPGEQPQEPFRRK
jgi:phospholipid/cholesterol/gamma-HCH transport system substrate-binding protein